MAMDAVRRTQADEPSASIRKNKGSATATAAAASSDVMSMG